MAECPMDPQPCPNSCPSCGRGSKAVTVSGTSVVYQCQPCGRSFGQQWPVTEEFDHLYMDIGGEG
jgi:hypothetical protein